MTDPRDPLEAELEALRPHSASPELRRRLAAALTGRSPWPRRLLVVVGGLAAACLVAILLWRRGGEPVPIPPPSPEVPVLAEDAAASVTPLRRQG